jgi:hypothetical protein
MNTPGSWVSVFVTMLILSGCSEERATWTPSDQYAFSIPGDYRTLVKRDLDNRIDEMMSRFYGDWKKGLIWCDWITSDGTNSVISFHIPMQVVRKRSTQFDVDRNRALVKSCLMEILTPTAMRPEQAGSEQPK